MITVEEMTNHGLIVSQGETGPQKKGSPDMHFTFIKYNFKNVVAVSSLVRLVPLSVLQ
jgi:hypothetical protein